MLASAPTLLSPAEGVGIPRLLRKAGRVQTVLLLDDGDEELEWQPLVSANLRGEDRLRRPGYLQTIYL